jgi:hypothetical protein
MMMGEFEAIGDVVSGAALARSVEPATGSGSVGSDGHTSERACLNCATPLVGDYCHACGQRGHVHRTLSAFFHDLLHGVFHFEGKVWRTLPLLAWRPGELTRDYVAGKRASFVSPMALFLFSVFLMFAIINGMGTPHVSSDAIKGGVAADAKKTALLVKELETTRAKLAATGAPTAAVDRKLKDARDEERLLGTLAERGVIQGTALRMSDDVPKWLAEPLQAAGQNPELLFYKLKNNAYKYSWALIPISLPFMWLLFPFSRRFRLYDHMVFVTYSLCFMTLLVVVASLVYAAGWSGVVALAMFIPPIHMYRQLKGAYGLGRWGALWRTIALIVLSMTTISLFIAFLFAVGIF